MSVKEPRDQQSDSIIMQINVVAVYYTSFAVYWNSYSFPTSDTERNVQKAKGGKNPGRKVFFPFSQREKRGGNLWLHFLAHQDRSWCLIHFFFSSLFLLCPLYMYMCVVYRGNLWCGSSRLLPQTSSGASPFVFDRQKNILDGCCLLPLFSYFCSLFLSMERERGNTCSTNI